MKSLAVKISLTVAVLVTLALALVPKIIGASIESLVINNLSAIIPPEVQNQFEIHLDEYTSGWFNSSTTIEIAYTPTNTDVIVLSMDFDIDHGPLLRTKDGLSAGLVYAVIQPSIRNDRFNIAIAELSFSLPDITLNLMARFNQSLRLGVNVGELKFSDATSELNFDGLDVNIEVAADQSASLSAQMGELSATENAANSNLLITGMTLTSSKTQMNDILSKTHATFSVPSVSSTLPLPFSILNIVVNYCLQASPDKENFSEIYQTIRLASIESEIPVSSFSWISEIKQVNNELLRDYYRLLRELQNEINADAVPEDLTGMGQELYLLVLRNLLELNNRVEANSYDGDHTADLNILWAGLSTLNNVSEIDIDTAIAALTITLDLSLDLDAILLSPLAGLVDPYVQEGYLTVSNGRVMVEASLQDSVLRVNGNELPLDQFF